MRAYGRRRAQPSETPELSEVTFLATPETLRALATFLTESAEQMEQHGPAFGHNHFRDSSSGWQSGWADVIVGKPDAAADLY